MRAEAPQTPSVSPIGRWGCCYHLTGSLEDTCSALYHLNREIDGGSRGTVNDGSERGNNPYYWYEPKCLHTPVLAELQNMTQNNMCASVKEKLNSGKKEPQKSPTGDHLDFVCLNNNESRSYANKQIRRNKLHCLLQEKAPASNPSASLFILS